MHFVMHYCKSKWITLHAGQASLSRTQEFKTQANTFFFIPIESLLNFACSFGTNDNLICHSPLHTLPFNSSHEIPSFEFCS